MEIIDKSNSQILEEYESFVKGHKNGMYLQSLRWPEIKNNWGWDAVISRDGEGRIRGTCLVLIKRIPVLKTSFLYAPHGPVFDYDDKETFADLLEGVKALGKKYKSYQFMCDPLFEEKDTEHIEYLRSIGFKHTEKAPAFTTVQVRENYMIRDIDTRTSDEIFAKFTTDYRNLVRKAPKRGVYCRVCGIEALDDFYSLYSETAERDGFAVRSKEYLTRFINAFGPDACRVFVCYVHEEGKEIPLSGAISTFYAGRGFYAFGASAAHHRNYYPNHLMQWTMINWAREHDCRIYDFAGIPDYDDKTKPAYGVYHFKKGFGGEVVVYAGEFYYTLRPVMTKIADLAHKVYDMRSHINHKREVDKREEIRDKAAKEREERNRGNSENSENSQNSENT